MYNDTGQCIKCTLPFFIIDYNGIIINQSNKMIFEHTYQNETLLHEAFIEENTVSIRQVTMGGDPIEDFVDYDPSLHPLLLA